MYQILSVCRFDGGIWEWLQIVEEKELAERW
jgi:hypothetical protein